MNIAIIGSGLTGSLAAISLAKVGCNIDLYERLSYEELVDRDRCYAITHSSRKILEKNGIWSNIVSHLIPFQYLNVIDYDLNNKVQFITDDLSLEDSKYIAVGWIADHKKIMSAILDYISILDNINKIPTSVIPNKNNYDLIVAADGSNSTTKKILKKPSFEFSYDQVCITAKVLLRGIKSNEAFEILSSEGPFAVLPLGGDLFQIICSQSKKNASQILNLPKSSFLDYLSTILPDGIIADTIINETKSYPIKFLLNYSFHSGKYIFLGETSHIFHPVGGQGLNLCWRDVNSLTKIASSPILTNYKWLIPIMYSLSRLFDVLSISILTDCLVRYSRSNSNLFYIPRLFIFFILRKSITARKIIINIMTNGI
ncbi:FAD-dependent monooxygenase [Prochlorococcus marinus]|uniref:2-polyprenyl-6-methoxyphenol hydroxylase n=1 Tax=Prochlorococcus marinus XMU1408 TaxID=2213228 RepID=A0A318R4S6_PROMR|nr:FAD-dependent monooxygenase [Prochlorococcus marinus]MBW3042007.1 2-polyprenyl-6-methoxyphenol hydroxylase [Prochlorococcus marinus str. XMU1408]PYE03130.1 2-polyprenyl-6-methoxyphenol hydroxylase [Prochlorococcus marinus XMU1408]